MDLAIGLMSGTSLDGIDAAAIESDGRSFVRPLGFLSRAYEPEFRRRLRGLLGGRRPVAAVEETLTRLHAEAVAALIEAFALPRSRVKVVGFHGQTILHAPAERRTWQIGDGKLLAKLTGLPVVSDFRSADVAAGGEGAPLAPLYHAARAASLERPLAVLNLGGVANLTWIGAGEGEILAFDTGPGNALLDDWVAQRSGGLYDEGGRLAAIGRIDGACLERLLAHPYFREPPPKSLDRDSFSSAALAELSTADGAATLTAFTAAAVARAEEHLPAPPRRWLVSGGGRHNLAIMQALAERLSAPVQAVEAVGWNGDAMEAEAFAYLALRSLAGLPLSLPGTTRVPRPMTGGRLDLPE